MKVVLLCGGHGMRIRDVAENIPKPMVPIGGVPILWHIMKHFGHWNHKEFVVCLGHKGEVIKDFFINYDSHTNDLTVRLGPSGRIDYHTNSTAENWAVTLADTGLDSLTGTRVKKVEKYLRDEKDFMLTYGDGVSDVDLDRLVAFHHAHGKIVTVTGVRPPGRFGEISSTPDGTITEFNEKPQSVAGRISGGYFVCRKEIFKYLDPQGNFMFEEGPLRRLVHDREMMMFEHNGFWQPMDTYRDYKMLNELFESKRAPWVVWK